MIRKMLSRAGLGACALLAAGSAQAQEFYVGQIITVGFNYCPDGTLEANGQTLSTTGYAALYALYGSRYGSGSGTFNLPDLRDRVQVGRSGTQAMGATGGQTTVTLGVSQLPSHTHTAALNASTAGPTSYDPTGHSLGTFPTLQSIYATTAPSVAMNSGSVSVGYSGSGSAVPVLDPYLVLRYCVVNDGVWPPMP
ncbi:MAG: tail fiber protein [Sphingomonas sp.]